jgi:hypothetical protein
MAYRTFTDGKGVRWEVWSVMLNATERRGGRERRIRSAGRAGVPPLGFTDRRKADRRRLRDLTGARARIAERYVGGWLAFESPTERRRLAPIPTDWETASEAELAAMCDTASGQGSRGPDTD